MLLGSQALTNDPYFNNVSLLLSARDGVIKDYSKTPKAISVFGNTSISSAQAKWGNKSIYFDGNGDYLSIPANQLFAFGTGDFTVEAWVYFSAAGGDKFVTNRLTQAGAAGTWALSIVNNKISFTEVIVGEPGVSSSISSIVGQWAYIAATRSEATLKIFLNGNLLNTNTSFSNNLRNYSYPLIIGGSINEAYFPGYCPEVRITKGIARTISVPTQPFPNW